MNGLRSDLLRELDHIIRMMPVWSKVVTRARTQYDMSKSGEDFIAFLDAHYRVVYMNEKMGWITELLRKNSDD